MDSFITLFQSILRVWAYHVKGFSSGPFRQPLLEYSNGDPFIHMIENHPRNEVLLWNAVEESFNNPQQRTWTSLVFREKLRELHGSVPPDQVYHTFVFGWRVGVWGKVI